MNEQSFCVFNATSSLPCPFPFSLCFPGKRPGGAGREEISPISSRGSRSPCRHRSQTKVSCRKGKGELVDATCPWSERSGCTW